MLGVDCEPVTIEASLKSCSSLSNILNPTSSARDKIYDIRCRTCDVVSDLMASIVAVADESIPFFHMVLTDYTSVGAIPEVTMLNGRRSLISKGRDAGHNILSCHTCHIKNFIIL